MLMSDKYIPFVQQPYCCVPACFLMIMYRHNIPLIAQDVLAYELGLTVPKKDTHIFRKVHTNKKPTSGWGTQIQLGKYRPNNVFPRLNIPLHIDQYFLKDFKNIEGLKSILIGIQNNNTDALLCFDYGRLWDKPGSGGHVCVFESLEDDTVNIIDPERNVPKFRSVPIEKLYKAMRFYGDSNSTGVWVVSKTENMPN